MSGHVEVNLDGLAGPTHMYCGLAVGDEASIRNVGKRSNPKLAALQGLAKMKLVMEAGVPQGILPPQERPDIRFLRGLGFEGTDSKVLINACQKAPRLVEACYSASSMWVANAGTVTPSSDTTDHLVHFTPANMISNLHRSLESAHHATVLKLVFPTGHHFLHHPPLIGATALADEGAANHVRICERYGSRGINLFVFGRPVDIRQSNGTLTIPNLPKQNPARHTQEASHAICRLHGIPGEQTVFATQNPDAIDAGVFHNDVISTGNEGLFLFHEMAFLNTERVVNEIQEKLLRISSRQPILQMITSDELSLPEAVQTYLFNCQIITKQDGTMLLIAPIECKKSEKAKSVLDRLVDDNKCPINAVQFVDLGQSMANGGGPACLRLRVVLSSSEFAKMKQSVLLTPHLLQTLTSWVDKYYVDDLEPNPSKLCDPEFLDTSRKALDELTQILDMGSIYSFQREY